MTGECACLLRPNVRQRKTTHITPDRVTQPLYPNRKTHIFEETKERKKKMLQRPSQRQLCWRIPTSPTMTPTLFTSCAAALILLCCCCVGHFSANAQWADDSAAFSGTAAPASMPPLMSITSTSFDIVHTPPGANGSHAAAQRRGKFFFDALFGLGSAVVNSGTGTLTAADDEDEDDEDDETDTTKRCDCRESKQHPPVERFF